MNLDEIAFPALIIADDGWVQEISRKNTLDFWRYSPITKYNRRRVIFYDSEDPAVDADDDILTQFSDGNEIRSALRETLSFKSVVSLLRSKGAI
jgi:hypothetical protein